MNIYVDLDNTICDTPSDHNYYNSIPIKHAISEINRLYLDGHNIIIYTARGNSSGINWNKLTRTQLQNWGVKYTQLIDNGKPSWDLIIDDKALNSYEWHKKLNSVVGFVASAFDLLHAGHMLMLKDAKSKCDYLIAALHIDPSIDRKEKSKPIQSIAERKIVLEGNKYIDEIILYDTEKKLVKILKAINPDIRILGSDWENKKYTGEGLSKTVYFHKRAHNWSSTELKQRIIDNK